MSAICQSDYYPISSNIPSQVVVFVLWSTKYTLAVLVSLISQPEGNGPNCETGCTCTWLLWPGPRVLIYCCRRGSTQVVVLVVWSTKYGLPSAVVLISQPDGRGPLPAVVVLLFNGKTPFAAGPFPEDGPLTGGGGLCAWLAVSRDVELALALGRSSGSIRALWRRLSISVCCCCSCVLSDCVLPALQ